MHVQLSNLILSFFFLSLQGQEDKEKSSINDKFGLVYESPLVATMDLRVAIYRREKNCSRIQMY
jgi:hypothetical protein